MNTRRAGFTLVEMLIVVLLGSIIMGSIYQMVVLQEQTTRSTYAKISTSENTQTALAILTSDLKEISARDGDIVALDSISITYRAMRNAGVVCTKSAGNDYVVVWELGSSFQPEDSVLVFADGTNASSANDDSWLPLKIASTTSPVACGTNPMAVTNTRRLNFNAAPLANVQVGSLIRSFKGNTRYRIADNSTWGELRRTESNIEQVLIDQMATISEGGMRLRYYDSAGVQIPWANLTARKADVMRIQIKATGKGAETPKSTGTNRFLDSLVTQVYLRGNRRGQ